MSPKVSVVIPVYNVAPYLREGLDSIVNQTLKEIEIICVNDGSTDNSLDILNEYAAKDNRFKIISQENAGSGPARNRGIEIATGEYLSVLDADDFFEDNMLEYLYYTVQKEQSDVAVCAFYVYDNQTKEDIKIFYPAIPDEIISPCEAKELGKHLFTFMGGNPWTKLWKTDIIKQNKVLFADYPYADDSLFSWDGLSCCKKISFTNIPFIHYRMFTETQQTFCNSKKWECILKTITTLYDNLIKRGIYEKYKRAYLLRTKTSMQFEFINGVTGTHRRKSLLSIPQNLPQPVVQELFSPEDRPAVSLIMAVYNMEQYLPKCLDSLVNQTLKNIEIICVDDGSTDGSLKILQDYAAKDNRIKILTQPNSRQSIARRNAMKIATGEYIQYVDADDYLDLETCECLYLYSKLYELDMCFFSGENFADGYDKHLNSSPMQLKWMPDDFGPVFSYKNLTNIVMSLNVGAALTFYRHDFLKENNIQWLNERVFYEDTPFFIESLLRAERIGALKENFYHRRKHAGATTENLVTNFPDFAKVVLMAFSLMKKYADETTQNNYFKDALQNLLNVYNYGCSEESRKKFKDILYQSFVDAKKIYDGPYSKDVKNWCKAYEKRQKKI